MIKNLKSAQIGSIFEDKMFLYLYKFLNKNSLYNYLIPWLARDFRYCTSAGMMNKRAWPCFPTLAVRPTLWT